MLTLLRFRQQVDGLLFVLFAILSQLQNRMQMVLLLITVLLDNNPLEGVAGFCWFFVMTDPEFLNQDDQFPVHYLIHLIGDCLEAIIRVVLADKVPQVAILHLYIFDRVLLQHQYYQLLHLFIIKQVALETGDLSLAHYEADLPDVVYKSTDYLSFHLA